MFLKMINEMSSDKQILRRIRSGRFTLVDM